MTKAAASVVSPEPSFEPNPQPSWIENSFENDVWLWRSAEGAARRLDFVTIPSKDRLFCKMFLWAIESTSDPRAGAFLVTSPRSFVRYFVEARLFLVECHNIEITRFMDITREMLDTITAKRLKRYSERDGSVSKGSLIMLASFYNRLYLLGPACLGVLPDGLAFDPDLLIPDRLMVRPGGCTSLIPDGVAQRIYSAAVDFLRARPERLRGRDGADSRKVLNLTRMHHVDPDHATAA